MYDHTNNNYFPSAINNTIEELPTRNTSGPSPKSAEEVIDLLLSGEADESDLDELIDSVNRAKKSGSISNANGEVKGDTLSAKPSSSLSEKDRDSSAAVSINGGVAAFRYTPPANKQAPGFFACLVAGSC